MLNRSHFLNVNLILSLLAVTGCSSSPSSPSPQETNFVSTGTDVPGRYKDGVYSCCARSEGKACCEGLETGMCFRFGGIYGECRKQGEQLEGKMPCARCCDGLQRLSSVVVGEKESPASDGLSEGCDHGGSPPSLLTCSDCGNGVCDAVENRCNCPQDCESR